MKKTANKQFTMIGAELMSPIGTSRDVARSKSDFTREQLVGHSSHEFISPEREAITMASNSSDWIAKMSSSRMNWKQTTPKNYIGKICNYTSDPAGVNTENRMTTLRELKCLSDSNSSDATTSYLYRQASSLGGTEDDTDSNSMPNVSAGSAGSSVTVVHSYSGEQIKPPTYPLNDTIRLEGKHRCTASSSHLPFSPGDVKSQGSIFYKKNFHEMSKDTVQSVKSIMTNCEEIVNGGQQNKTTLSKSRSYSSESQDTQREIVTKSSILGVNETITSYDTQGAQVSEKNGDNYRQRKNTFIIARDEGLHLCMNTAKISGLAAEKTDSRFDGMDAKEENKSQNSYEPVPIAIATNGSSFERDSLLFSLLETFACNHSLPADKVVSNQSRNEVSGEALKMIDSDINKIKVICSRVDEREGSITMRLKAVHHGENYEMWESTGANTQTRTAEFPSSNLCAKLHKQDVIDVIQKSSQTRKELQSQAKEAVSRLANVVSTCNGYKRKSRVDILKKAQLQNKETMLAESDKIREKNINLIYNTNGWPNQDTLSMRQDGNNLPHKSRTKPCVLFDKDGFDTIPLGEQSEEEQYPLDESPPRINHKKCKSGAREVSETAVKILYENTNDAPQQHSSNTDESQELKEDPTFDTIRLEEQSEEEKYPIDESPPRIDHKRCKSDAREVSETAVKNLYENTNDAPQQHSSRTDESQELKEDPTANKSIDILSSQSINDQRDVDEDYLSKEEVQERPPKEICQKQHNPAPPVPEVARETDASENRTDDLFETDADVSLSDKRLIEPTGAEDSEDHIHVSHKETVETKNVGPNLNERSLLEHNRLLQTSDDNERAAGDANASQKSCQRRKVSFCLQTDILTEPQQSLCETDVSSIQLPADSSEDSIEKFPSVVIVNPKPSKAGFGLADRIAEWKKRSLCCICPSRDMYS